MVLLFHCCLAGADDVPPPKPSRQPQNMTEQSQLSASAAPVSTYIVAQSPEVLAQLLKDNQARGVCPSVYTTPASPFNTLAVQFQDEEILTTTLVSDLPFFDPALSEPPSITTQDTTQSGGDSTLSDTNLDSLDSSDNTPLMSSLSISDTAVQTQSPAANRKQQKIKEMQNLYAVSSKVVGSITGDLYSPVQKFSASSAVPLPSAAAAASVAIAGNTCGEIYGPVASFTQSSAIVGNLSQSASVGGNYGENPGNFGPSSLGSSVIMPNSSQQFATSGPHAQSQPINYGNFVVGNNTSQIFAGGSQSTGQNASGAQSASCSNGSGGGGGGVGSSVIYPRNISSANIVGSASSAECLYGPVLKFRAQNAQLQPTVADLKPAGTTAGNYGQAGRANLMAQNLKSQPLYPQNYPHQQIYSNIAQPGQQAMYLPQMQHVQNVVRQNAVPQAVSYAAIQHTNQQSQLSGANPIYTAHATSVSLVQAQKLHVSNYSQQAQPGISSQPPASSQIIGGNQPVAVGMMQASSVPSHFITSSSVIQQNIIHPIPSGYMVEQPSSLGPLDHANVDGIMTSSISAHQQQVAQPQIAGGPPKTVNVPQMATGVAKITSFVTSQKQDEQLTSSTDGTLSGSLISSAVSDSTMSSSSSMTEEAQQDQV